VLASGLEYTDVLIRRHLYPQTAARRPPFVLGYDVVGEIDQFGDGVSGFPLGDRVADMTVLGSNAAYCTCPSDNTEPAHTQRFHSRRRRISHIADCLADEPVTFEVISALKFSSANGNFDRAVDTMGRLTNASLWTALAYNYIS